MFRQLATALPPLTGSLTPADAVFTFHPEQLSRWLDEVWAQGGISAWPNVFNSTNVPLGDPAAVKLTQIPNNLLAESFKSGVGSPTGTPPFPPPLGYNPPAPNSPPPVVPLWDHMFYAYLVESTGAVEIFAEVVRRYVVGETLPAPSAETMAWVRATEELFFRDPPLFRVGGLTSQLRPDARVNRRNAYWRMFGLDLPHPAPGIDGQAWKRDAGAASNIRFIEIWNELLRQVWLGIENERNTSGSNPTDASYIGYLCQTLAEMLRLRRLGGMLSREEFSYGCMLNWFHLTVGYESAVVRDLSANAGVSGGNPADRLATVGARVGVAPSRQARELFELASLVSPLLWAIELGLFDQQPKAELLYRSSGISAPAPAQTMNRIIDLWQSATGERVKDLAVTTRHSTNQIRSAQPAKLLPAGVLSGASASAAPTTNGQRRVAPRL
ncbi:hypothetical protein [Nocardia iowensis]|uniref:Uncharacterized protein n=1 Tax=Nocardia iowensis TaxID=204891 RepID=A0ABX8RYV0_NOCIO|nr:hypothetical protein [Nocardia iowensis]QXN94024.1 hypothetical protein KV110_13745 [Nocardia iowensis]